MADGIISAGVDDAVVAEDCAATETCQKLPEDEMDGLWGVSNKWLSTADYNFVVDCVGTGCALHSEVPLKGSCIVCSG